MADPTRATHAADATWSFVADHVALDFINTEYGVGSSHVESLGSDQQVLNWLERAGLRSAQDTFPSGKPGALLTAALQLRKSARTLVERRKAGGSADASVLNRVLALGTSHQQLIWKKGNAPVLKRLRGGSTAEAALVPVAEAIAALLVDGDFDLIRKCESDDCTLWFVDRTRSHRRRWCSMAVCGNRAKVAAFRERQKDA
jgi:predicted RNA-binding Zn ribbon-like protein